MGDILKEAIADAKAVRETALQNAKMALEQYKNFLITRNAELDHNYHIMNSLLEFHDCNNYSDDYNILNNCISKIY